jgi:hypothetical protein
VIARLEVPGIASHPRTFVPHPHSELLAPGFVLPDVTVEGVVVNCLFWRDTPTVCVFGHRRRSPHFARVLVVTEETRFDYLAPVLVVHTSALHHETILDNTSGPYHYPLPIFLQFCIRNA